MNPMKFPKAFIFDLDGVLTDTAEFHYQAWKRLAEELGVSIDREFNEQLKGISRMESLERILALNPELSHLTNEEKAVYATKKNDHYLQLIKTISPKDILPGIRDFLSKIKEHGLKIALGSASKNAKLVLNQLELTSFFDYVVDAAKVKRGKPDPETFTTAADFFSIPYSACIGVEDAAAGVDAINRAGMFSVAVGSKEQLGHADLVFEDTSKLDFDEIIRKYQEKG